MSDQQGAAPAEAGPVIYKGLAGVPVDYTAVSKVNPETNSLLYRGYPVQELAASVHLRGGRVPALVRRAPRRRRSSAEFEERERVAPRARPRGASASSTSCRSRRTRWTSCAPPSASSARAIRRPPTTPARRTSTRRSACSRSCPSIVAYDQRRRRELELVEPRDDLGYSANFLWHDVRRGARVRGRRTRSTCR